MADEEAREAVRTWARGLTDADIERIADDTAKVTVQMVAFAGVISKIKTASDSGIQQVVLTAEEISALLWGINVLRTPKKA